jgi:serine protease Do
MKMREFLPGRMVLRSRLAAASALAAIAVLSTAAAAADFDAQKVYGGAAPGVVFVGAFSGDSQMAGTGSIIAAEGLVLTNAHVVLQKSGEPAPNVVIWLRPDRVTGDQKADLSRRYKATLLAFDRELDLALIRMEEPPPALTVLQFGDSMDVSIGQKVAAIGHPEQGGFWSLTTGVISAEFMNFNNVAGKHVFQSEVGLNRGNSGGPLLDANGNQVGVNTMISRLAKDGMPITSISFSLKSSVAKEWLEKQGLMVAYAVPAPRTVAAAPMKPSAVVTQPAEQPAPAPAPPAAAKAKAEIPPPHPYNLDETMSRLQKLEGEMNDLADEMKSKIKSRSRR